MDGIEAIAVIRRKEIGTGVHLPIVALTAHAMKGDRKRCLAAGVDDYLTRPIHKLALFAALERIRTAKITEGSAPATVATMGTNAKTSSYGGRTATRRGQRLIESQNGQEGPPAGSVLIWSGGR